MTTHRTNIRRHQIKSCESICRGLALAQARPHCLGTVRKACMWPRLSLQYWTEVLERAAGRSGRAGSSAAPGGWRGSACPPGADRRALGAAQG